MRHLVVTVPSEQHRDRLGDLGDDVDVLVWDLAGAPPAPRIDLVVRPYDFATDGLGRLDPEQVVAVQGQSLGYDDVPGVLPDGIVYCNAVGVHEESTAEIAVALTLASLRGLDRFARAHETGAWLAGRYPSLLDAQVLLVGYGGIGRAVARRLDGFGARITAVARAEREVEGRWIHAMRELPDLLGEADVVIIAVPYGPQTHQLVDDAFCARMRSGALLVNVARGKIADTDAITRHARAGRLRLALDVIDPEPLPPDHPLWSTPGVLISPHTGGGTTAMDRRVDALIVEQVQRLREGRDLAHVVLGP